MQIAIDHLLVAAPELEVGRDFAESLFGTRPVIGGVHPGQGTRNALLGLEDDVYIEVIAPDPEQPAELPVSRFLRACSRPAFAWWCARCDELEALAAALESDGVDAGGIDAWSRRRPDGGTLRWRLMMPAARGLGAALPFFISWDDMRQHPSRHLPVIGTLESMTIVHPRAPSLPSLPALVETKTGAHASVSASIRSGPRSVELRMPGNLLPAIGEIIASGN